LDPFVFSSGPDYAFNIASTIIAVIIVVATIIIILIAVLIFITVSTVFATHPGCVAIIALPTTVHIAADRT
jgi:hypothetical protein